MWIVLSEPIAAAAGRHRYNVRIFHCLYGRSLRVAASGTTIFALEARDFCPERPAHGGGHLYLARLPWPKINSFLLRLESAASGDDLEAVALAGIGELIPWDSSVVLMDYSLNVLSALGAGDADARLFAEYYRQRLPIWRDGRVGALLPDLAATNRIDWERFRDSEFVVDFARPRGWARSICQFKPRTGQSSALCIQRSGTSPDFTEEEDRDAAHREYSSRQLAVSARQAFRARSRRPFCGLDRGRLPQPHAPGGGDPAAFRAGPDGARNRFQAVHQ